MMSMISWQMFKVGEPLRSTKKPLPELRKKEVLVEVSGCGVCHTDLGFYYEGVRTKSSMPLTLGHEISGTVIKTGSSVSDMMGKKVVIPAVIPCGSCDVCNRGLGNICSEQKMLGNDIDGGFASHVVVSGDCLCEVPVDDTGVPLGQANVSLPELSVVADALSTPYQAILDSGLVSDDVAIFVGVGGVGGFGAQIAKALGSCVIAIDIDDDKLALVDPYVDAVFNSREMSFKELRKQIFAFVKRQGRRLTEWKIFETSGSVAGQKTAFGLLTFGAHLAVVGFTMEMLNLRLSNLMAFHATAKGNWGCLPEYYPSVLDMVLSGKVELRPFTEIRSLSEINSVFEHVNNHLNNRRIILVP